MTPASAWNGASVKGVERCDALLVKPAPDWMPRLATTSLELEVLKNTDWLSLADRRIASRYRHDKRLRDFLLGRRAAYAAISSAFPHAPTDGFRIERGIFDQPVWTGGDIHGLSLSIAHSDGIGAALVAPPGFPIGLDLECVSERLAPTMAKQMTGHEHQLIREMFPAASAAEQLTVLWCAKEALSKALGCGMTCPMEVMEIAEIERDGMRLSGTFSNFYQYRFHAWRHQDSKVLAMVMHRHHRFDNNTGRP